MQSTATIAPSDDQTVDSEATLDHFIAEIQAVLDQIAAGRHEIEQLKAETRAIQAETEAVLAKLSGTP